MGPSNTMNRNQFTSIQKLKFRHALLCEKKYENSRKAGNRPKSLFFDAFCFKNRPCFSAPVTVYVKTNYH